MRKRISRLEVFDGIAFQVTPLLKEIIEKNLNHFFPRFRNIVKHRGNTIQYRWLRDLLRFKVGLLQESFREKSLSHKFQFEPVDNLLELLESEIVREESYGYEEEIVLLYEIIQKSPSSTEISLLPFRKSEKAHLANLMAYKGQYQNCSGSYTMRDVEHIDWLLQGLLQNII
ncbi:MAG: hypothetical protein Q4B29_01125 [Candidatus Saccharibacteria bacterium]|nr:hypothetical protein [Candidatus Saccharibacteria bacterium]